MSLEPYDPVLLDKGYIMYDGKNYDDKGTLEFI